MTELEQCKATLREDARRLCDKSKHAQHPFGDCPCSVLRVIEELEANQIPGRCRECKHYEDGWCCFVTHQVTASGTGFCDRWEARE